jgi:hypothetical protein
MTTIYKAVTPYGAFQATWGDDEESRVEYTGSADAIEYFKAFLGLNSISGRGGALIEFDSLEPADLYGFCQSEKYGITVLPTEDDLMDELENNDMTTTVLDAVSPAEAFELIGEGAQILGRLDENADTFFGDLDRLRHIVTELGDDAPEPEKRKLEWGAYETTEDFEKDYEAMGDTGRAAMVYAGMGRTFDSQQMSLRQMVASITSDRMSELRLDPASNKYANEYTNLRSAINNMKHDIGAKDGIMDKIRGPWAAKLFDFFTPGGELAAHPHMVAEKLKQFAEMSKGYGIAKKVKVEPVADQHAEARTYLNAVIGGTLDLSDLAVADELGKIHAASADNADMLALFKSAVEAYAAYAIAQADAALKE